MRRHFWMSRGVWLCGVAGVLLLSAAARAGEEAPERRRVVVGPMELEVDLDAITVSDYWIGLACGTLSDEKRKELALEGDDGILVLDVLADGPAEKAGFKMGDVLLKADQKPLKEVPDLIHVVEAAKDKKEVAIELIRDREALTIKVTPTKRPEELRLPQLRGSDDPRWREAIKEYYQKFWPDRRFRILHPGAILPPGSRIAAQASTFSLPSNMSVVISKEGDQPAKVKVTKDDETWEVTEDEIDKLPKEVRQHVERMMGGIRRFRVEVFDFVPKEWPTLPRIEVPRIKALPKVRPESPLEKRLEEMKGELEELRKSIDELRKDRPAVKTPKAEDAA